MSISSGTNVFSTSEDPAALDRKGRIEDAGRSKLKRLIDKLKFGQFALSFIFIRVWSLFELGPRPPQGMGSFSKTATEMRFYVRYQGSWNTFLAALTGIEAA
jgi:hypothetical protein